jgi:hypothetical protein
VFPEEQLGSFVVEAKEHKGGDSYCEGDEGKCEDALRFFSNKTKWYPIVSAAVSDSVGLDDSEE